jgi:hypothetical protein
MYRVQPMKGSEIEDILPTENGKWNSSCVYILQLFQSLQFTPDFLLCPQLPSPRVSFVQVSLTRWEGHPKMNV